ncbi:MAG: transcription antitermination factor NusB [Acidimicrobiales bacterium]
MSILADRRRPKKQAGKQQARAGVDSRRLAVDALIRIETGGAYANIVLPDMLAKSSLADEDRRFVTQLVYGTTRMKRACDHLVDRYLLGPADEQIRAALRLGAFQLAFLATPPHAAVDATVGAVTGGGRKVVNAVLRRVADSLLESPPDYPDDATRLSYPDWIVDRFREALGPELAVAALEAMNQPATTATREDGYVQDPASQLVVEAVGARDEELVVDLCAAPGGKATGMARSGATVIAGDRRPSRVGLVVENVERLGSDVVPVVADGRAAPFADRVADRVLVDAPCSGFGSLRRRPDARWRIDPDGPQRLSELQSELVSSGIRLLKPGGTLTYSVCTFGEDEGRTVVERAMARHDVELLDRPGDPWLDRDGMAVIVPGQSDGMMLAQLRKRS